MKLLEKLATLFSATAQGGSIHSYPLVVQCQRCGEIIRTQINLANDLSVEYDEHENIKGYICRKVLIGKQRCFQPIQVTLTFDARRKLIDRTIEHGQFLQEP